MNAWGDCQSDCPSECTRWVEASDGDIPPGAYQAGLPEYVVRAQHEGGLYPGTFLPQLGELDIPWRGQTISKSQYQVLLIRYYIFFMTQSGYGGDFSSELPPWVVGRRSERTN